MLKEIKKIKETQLELICEASFEEMAPCLNRATKRISQRIKIHGFRPGKAPYEVVKKEIGEMDIYQEALDEIISQCYFKIVSDEKLRVIGQPKIDLQIFVPGQPIVFKATIDLLPKVKLGDYKKNKIQKPKIEIRQTQVDDTLKDLQKKRVKETLVNREVQNGDKVNINIEMFFENVPLEDGQIRDHSLVVGEPYFIAGFSEKIIGLKDGEEKEFELKMPENYYKKSLANKIVKFKVKVNKVYQLDLPELNDEFAINLGQFKSLNDLTAQIKNNLEIEENFKIKEKMREEILEKIINQSSFEEIPDSLIESETNKMFSELEEEIMKQGMKMDDYLSHIKKTKLELEKDFLLGALKRIKAILVMREIAENETVQAVESEIMGEINELLKTYPTDEKIRERIQSESFRRHLEIEITNRKIFDFLEEICVEK